VLERGAALAERTGRERVLLVLSAESVATLIELGRPAAAMAAGAESVDLARLAGNPRMLMWAHSALASARLAAGDVAGDLDEAARAAPVDARPDIHAAGQPGWCLGPLTPRDQEIAGLVAAGRTNREVAAQLVLSTRSIEAHLRNVYGKLGVRSRVELAREVRHEAQREEKPG